MTGVAPGSLLRRPGWPEPMGLGRPWTPNV